MEAPEAIMLAKNHINKLNLSNPADNKIEWIVSEPKRTKNGWYFDYEFKPTDPNEEVYMAGAPGFFINSDSSEIMDVSWGTYQSFKFQP